MNSDEKQKEGFGSIFHWEEEQTKGACDPRPIFRALTRASGLTEREWSQVDIIMPSWSRCGLDAPAQFWFYRMVQIDLISWEEKSGDQVITPTPEHLPFMGNIPHLRDALLSLQGSALPGIGSNCRFASNDERFPMPLGDCEWDLVKC